MSGGGGFRGRGFPSRGHFCQGSDRTRGSNLHQNQNDSRAGNAGSRSRGSGGPRMGFRGNGPRPNLHSDVSITQTGGTNFRSPHGPQRHQSQTSDNNWSEGNWHGNIWSDNNGCNNWSDNTCNNWPNNNVCNNWSDNNGINNWADNNGGNNWSDNSGGNNWSDNNPSNNWSPQGIGCTRASGPPRVFSPWRAGCPPHFNAPPPFFHPPGQNAFPPYRFLPPMGGNFPPPNIHEYSSTEGSSNSQNQPVIQNSTSVKKSSNHKKIQNPPKPHKPQKQTPHPGSEEERAQKITEAADKLKRTLSTNKKKIPDSWYENEDEASEFSLQDSDYEPRIAHRGIPELKHEPPELNLTLNDLRDIGRIDHDCTTRGTNVCNEASVDDHEVMILEHNPVQLPKAMIDISQDDNENDDGDNVTQSESNEENETSKNIADANENSVCNAAKIDDSTSCIGDIEQNHSDKKIMNKSDERINLEENFVEESSTNDFVQRNRREEINENSMQNAISKKENFEICVAENSQYEKEMANDDHQEETNNKSHDAVVMETEKSGDDEGTATSDINKIHDEGRTIEHSSVLCQSANKDSLIGIEAKISTEIEKLPVETGSSSNKHVKMSEGRETFEMLEKECEVGEKIHEATNATVNFDECAEIATNETTKEMKNKVVISREKDAVTDVRAGSERAMIEEKTGENREKDDNVISSDNGDSRDGISRDKEINAESMENIANGNVNLCEGSCGENESLFRDNTLINETRENANATKSENSRINATTDNVTSLQVRPEITQSIPSNENEEESRLNRKESSTEKEIETRNDTFLDKTKTQKELSLMHDNRRETGITSGKLLTSQLSLASKINISKESEGQRKVEVKSSTDFTRNKQKREDHRKDPQIDVSTDVKSNDSKYSKDIQRDDQLDALTDAKISERKKLVRKMSQEKEASRNRKSTFNDFRSDTVKSPHEDVHPSDTQSSLESTLSNSCNQRGHVNSSQSKKCHLSSTTKFQKDDISPLSVKFNPKQPPPNISGIQDSTQPNLPPAFDPRLSSHERSVILSSAIPMKQDFIMTQGYPPCTLTNVPPINYVVPPAVPSQTNIMTNSIKPTSNIPPICMPDPYAVLMPLPNVPSLVPSMVLTNDILLQPPLPAELPPPPPPPVKSTINMEAELEDMHEAMEFAKQFMNMTEPCKTVENQDIHDAELSDESDIFHMPTFPDLPPIELPPPLPSPERKEIDDIDAVDCSQITTKENTKNISNKSARHEVATYGPAPKPEDYSENIDHAETPEEPMIINDEHLRPKVVFNLNSKLKKISKLDEWHLQNQRNDEHENYLPVISTTSIISSMGMRKSRKNKIIPNQSSIPVTLTSSEKSRVTDVNEEAKQRDDKTSLNYNGKIDSSDQNYLQSNKKTGETKARSLTPPRPGRNQKIIKHNEENPRKFETDKSEICAKRLGKELLSKRSKDSQTPESAWKNRVIGRFLKMSKNDICNMLNNASLRKFDIAMKHLVKERRPSLSLEMRNNEEERMRDAETPYNRDEFMDQLSAMLDPSATVDICNLPTQFIHHLSEVLQLDVMPEFESQQNKAETIAKASSPLIQPPSGAVCRQKSGDSRETVDTRENDEQRGKKRESNKHSSKTMEQIVSAGSSEKSKVVCATERTIGQWSKREKINPENSSVIGPRLRRRRLRTAVLDKKTITTNNDDVVNHQSTLNMADLDDIFSAGIARVKKKLADVPTMKMPIKNDQHCNDNTKIVDKNVDPIIKDTSVDRVERAVVELDEIFSAGIARAKLASKKAAEAAKVAEANDADVDENERAWNHSHLHANLDTHRLKQKTSTFGRDSPKIDEWNRRKNCEEPAAFRNLTKEEWEARYGESSYSSYQREYHAMEVQRAQKLQYSPTSDRQNFDLERGEISGVRSHLLDSKMGIPDFHESWSGSEEHRRLQSTNEATNHEINSNRNNDDSSSTTSSDSCDKNNDEAAPSVTKLLKVIKEREKIAKQKSLNEEIRDEVTAEIEHKKRERDKVRKRHKLRTKKSGHHRRKRDKKDYSRDRKKRDRKRRKHKSRRSNENSRENSDNEDDGEEYASSPSRGRSSRRLLAEDEIKKEIIVKEEPATEVRLSDEKVYSKNSINVKSVDDSRPTLTASSSSASLPSTVAITSIANQTTIIAQQLKTKAQLKQMPNDLTKKVTTGARINKETAKNQKNLVSDNDKDNIDKNVCPVTVEISSVINEPENSVNSKDTKVIAPIISIEKSATTSDDITSKNNTKKLDIKTYKERAKQRQEKQIEKVVLLAENSSSLSGDLLNIPLTHKNENEPTENSVQEALKDPRLKKNEEMSNVSTIIHTTSTNPTSNNENSAPMLSAKTSISQSNVEKRIPPVKVQRKKIVRRPIAAIASTSVHSQSTVQNVSSDVGKFAHIKSEGRKELKLREKLKRERSRTFVDSNASSNNSSLLKPTKLRRRKNIAVPSTSETIPVAGETKTNKVPLSVNLDDTKTRDDSNTLIQSITETVINAKESDTAKTLNTIVNFDIVDETRVKTTAVDDSKLLDATRIISENFHTAENVNEKNEINATVSLDNFKTRDIAVTPVESKSVLTTKDLEASKTPNILNQSPKRLSSDGLPEIEPEDPLSAIKDIKTEKILETESKLITMELPVELPVWSLDAPLITSNIPDTMEYSSDSGPFKGFSEETILRRDRVLTEAEITEDSELTTFESVPLKFVSDNTVNTTENIDLNVLTSTRIVDTLDAPLTYTDEEFTNIRVEIESSLPDPLGHPIFPSVANEIIDVPSTIGLESLQSLSIDENHDETGESQELNETSLSPNLENSSNIDDFIIENVNARETVPSPILVNEATTNDPDDLETVVLSSKIEKDETTEIKTNDTLENNATELETSSMKLLTNTRNTITRETLVPTAENRTVETETLQHHESIVTPEKDIRCAIESLRTTVDKDSTLVENSNVPETQCNTITSMLTPETQRKKDLSRMNESTFETLGSEDIPKNSSNPADEEVTSKEMEKSLMTCREKPDVGGKWKNSYHSRMRDHSYDRSKKKSSRHYNHGSRATKKSTLTGRMVEDAITANVVKLAAKPNSRDTVMARMIEIDVEIHKLMNEKMTLYKMLESGDFTSQESQDFANKTIDETKIVVENDETTEVVSTNVLASRLAQNLTTTPPPTISIATAATSGKNHEETTRRTDTKRFYSEIEDKKKKGKKSPHRETKNRSTERDIVADLRGEKKCSETKCNTTRIMRASEESSRRETPSRNSREKSTSSTDLDDAEEKHRKASTKSPIRQYSKCHSVHSSKEDLVQVSRDNTDRVEKCTKSNESKRDKPKKKLKSSMESRNMEETEKRSKIHDEKSAGVSNTGKKTIRTDDIYSDESTFESQVHADTTKSNEVRNKKDKLDNYTGLTLLEKSFKRDVAHHRKIKNSEKRKSKKRDMRRAMRDPTILTPNEAQTGLINLFNRKKLQKRSVSSLNRDKAKLFVSTNGDHVKVWKHVSSVIDAVAKNRIEELYTEESKKPSYNVELPNEQTQDKVSDLNFERDEKEKTDMEEKVVSRTLEETTNKTEASRLHDKSETAITADCKGFTLTETNDSVETILLEKQQAKSSNLEIKHRETSPNPSDASFYNVPKKTEIYNEKTFVKSDSPINRDEGTSNENVTKNEESFDESTIVQLKTERENDQEEQKKVMCPSRVRSLTPENLKPWRIDLFAKTIEPKKEQSTENSKSCTNWKDDNHEEGTHDDKMMGEKPEMNKTLSNDNNEDIPRSRSRNSRRTKQRGKSQSDKGNNVITQKKDNQNSSSRHEHVSEDDHDDDKSSRRPRSANNRNFKQREKSDRSHRRTSRQSEDRSNKNSRYRKRERDYSNSRGLSPSEDETSRKRSLHQHRSSSPLINASAFDDRSKKPRGKKRKRRAEMSLEEMTKCKVELIDCKYTYLSPTMHPKILKKLGISRINRHVAPRIIAENFALPLLTRNETPSPPILHNFMEITEHPRDEDNDNFEKIEISTGHSEKTIASNIFMAGEDEENENVEKIRSPTECLIVKENVDDDDEDDEDDDNIQIVKAVDENSPIIEHGHEDDDNYSNKEIAQNPMDQADNNETGTEMITVEEDDDTMEEYEVIDEVTDENEDTDENEQMNSKTEDTEHEEAMPASTDETAEPEESLVPEENDIEDEPRRTKYTVHKGPILDIKVLDDSFLAASEDGAIYRYSQTSNGILNIYKGHDAAVTCIYVLQTPGKRWNLYSGSLDGTFRSYDITTGAQDRPANVGSPVQCMDQGWGIIYIGTKSGHISRYNIKSGSLKGDRLEFSDKSVLALKASAEGPRRVLIVASRNQPITIRDANTGLFLRTICGYKNHTVYSLMRDKNLVYCGTSSTSIPVYDFTNGEQITQYNAGVGIVCMRLYRQILFAGCYDGNIYVFDTKEAKLLCSIPGPGNMLLSMEVVNDEIIAGSKNRQLHLWRMPKKVQALLAERT